MTLTKEQFRQQLVDYLYGELQGAERDAFERRLAASEPHRRELEAMRGTLASARSGLAELQEAPPPALHRRILALAQQETEPDQTAPTPTPATVERGRHPWPPNHWAPRWLRSPTFISAAGLATVALLAVLSRKALHSRPEDLTTTGVSAPAAQPTPEVSAGPSAADEAARSPGAGPAQPNAATGMAADSPADTSKPTPAEVSPQRRPARTSETLEEPKKKGGAADPRPSAARSYAEPPPSWNRRPAAAPAESSTPKASAERGSSAQRREGESRPQPPASPPAAGAPPPAPEVSASARGIGSMEEFERSAADADADADARHDLAGAGAAPSSDQGGNARYAPNALIRRAEAHLAMDRPREAARAYRALLRRFPEDPRRADWQRQLTMADRAQRSGRSAAPISQ